MRRHPYADATLDGKVALITGQPAGAAGSQPELFAREGARVVVADVVEGRRQRDRRRHRDAGGDAAFVQADVSQRRPGRRHGRSSRVDTYGGLHVLYNNAGILPPDDGGTLDTPESTWEQVMAVNLKGVWLGCKAGIPAMLASGGGSIVNVVVARCAHGRRRRRRSRTPRARAACWR